MLDEGLSSIGFLLLGLSFAELATEVTDQIKSVIHSLIKNQIIISCFAIWSFFQKRHKNVHFSKAYYNLFILTVTGYSLK